MTLKRISLGVDSSGRPLVVDERTKAKLDRACQLLGFALTIVQGSYRGGSGAAASAGTHDRAGVIDIRTWNIPAHIGVAKVIRVLRECGLIAWYRTKAQGFDPHIHAIDYGNPDLAPSAARQVAAWEGGRNGLASEGPDDGPRINIPKNPPPPHREDWFTMATKEELQEALEAVLRRDDTIKAPRHWPTSNPGTSVESGLASIWQTVIDARADAAAAAAGVKALAASLDELAPGVADKVTAAVREALAEAVVDVEIKVTGGND